MHGRDGGVVEQAEAHRPVRFRVVPGRTHGGEGRPRPAFHDRIHRHAGAAGGTRRRLGAAGAHDGIAVELHRFPQVGLDRQDAST